MRVCKTLEPGVGVCCLRLRYVVPLNYWEREIEKFLCPPSYCIDYVCPQGKHTDSGVYIGVKQQFNA